MAGGRGASGPLLLLLLLLLAARGAWSARGRGADKQNSLRRAASGVYQGVSGLFGEENVRALQKVSLAGGGGGREGGRRWCARSSRARPLGGRPAVRALSPSLSGRCACAGCLGRKPRPRCCCSSSPRPLLLCGGGAPYWL